MQPFLSGQSALCHGGSAPSIIRGLPARSSWIRPPRFSKPRKSLCPPRSYSLAFQMRVCIKLAQDYTADQYLKTYLSEKYEDRKLKAKNANNSTRKINLFSNIDDWKHSFLNLHTVQSRPQNSLTTIGTVKPKQLLELANYTSQICYCFAVETTEALWFLRFVVLDCKGCRVPFPFVMAVNEPSGMPCAIYYAALFRASRQKNTEVISNLKITS